MSILTFTLDATAAWQQPCKEWQALVGDDRPLSECIDDQRSWALQWQNRKDAPQQGVYRIGEQWAEISLSYDTKSAFTHVFVKWLEATPDLDLLTSRVNQLQLITDRLPILIGYVDRSIQFRFVNHYYEQWTGNRFSDIVGKTVLEIVAKSCKPGVVQFLEKCIKDVLAGQTVNYVTEMTFPNGSLHHISFSLLPHHQGDRIPGYFVLGLDITEQVEAERALRQSELRYRTVVESQADLVARLDANYACSLVNPAFSAIAAEGTCFWDCFVEPDVVRLKLESLTPSQPDFTIEAECWLRDLGDEQCDEHDDARCDRRGDRSAKLTRDRSHERRWYHWVGRALFDVQSNLSEIQVVGRNVQDRHLMQLALQKLNHDLESRVQQRTVELETAITALKAEVDERQRAETQLHYRAYHDALTGLPNRKLFLERVNTALRLGREAGGQSCALLFVDVDRFKMINDSLGHAIGDQLLIATARRLEQCLFSPDSLARWGGDEFTVLLEAVPDWSEAVHLAEVMQSAMRQPFYLQGREIYCGISIGIALANRDYAQAEDLIRDADIAMYRAKANGGGTFQRFDRSMHLQVLTRLHLETELRQAIAASTSPLQVYFQPIFDLASGQIVSAEALIRWHHPQRGIIKPAELLPIAEDANLLGQLDFWVLRHACQQIYQWRSLLPAHFKLNVNLAPSHFNRPTLVPDLLNIVSETGLPPERLRIEITEGALMNEPQRAAIVLKQLADHGIGAMIDDFGTGYSSLSRLHHLPIEGLKIDRSFVADLATEPALVQVIMALAANLKLSVVAEGIEQGHQVERLLALECRYGQGFYFAPPLPAPDFKSLFPEQFARAKAR